MGRGGINLDYLIRIAKANGFATEATIALWTGRLGNSVYMAWRQLKMMCEEGLLDDDKVKCVVNGSRIVFKPVQQDAKSWEEVEEYLKKLKEGDYEIVGFEVGEE